jgi:hypothetical protein
MLFEFGRERTMSWFLMLLVAYFGLALAALAYAASQS